MIDARRHGQDGHDSEDDGGAHGHHDSISARISASHSAIIPWLS
jgi:hypothetical protein